MQISLHQILALEQALHKNETRQDKAKLDELLHPEFMEIGRSGKRYSRQDILKEFATEKSLPEIEVSAAELYELRPGLVQLHYISNHKTDHAHRFTYRSSLWEFCDQRWLIRFHQGTAISD